QAHGMSLDNFLDTVLKNDGTFWADNILISAAARTFNVDLVIVHNDGKKPSVSRRSNPEGLLYLAHEVEQHYQALEEDPTLAPQEVLDAYRIGAAIDELERQGERGLRR
ncbi:MAG: hypothetical protein K0Q74_744, partial [Gammaproteobacteria bacterium]|nr:hypothetical protein [Gammaproteobacteria bacterium]